MIVIGTGNQAFEYVKILLSYMTEKKIHVIGNTQEGCEMFSRRCYDELNSIIGISSHKEFNDDNYRCKLFSEQCVICTPVMTLSNMIIWAFEHITGLKNILVEKPGALYSKELIDIESFCKKRMNNTKIYFAYNRRYFTTIQEVKKIIDGSENVYIDFKFGEPYHDIIKSRHPINVVERWVIANSSHVIDAILYLCSGANNIECSSHDNHYVGDIIIDKGLAVYNVNWKNDHRWEINITADKNKYVLKPFEQLRDKSGNIIKKESEDSFYKNGMKEMVFDFIADNKSGILPEISEQIKLLNICEKIINDGIV